MPMARTNYLRTSQIASFLTPPYNAPSRKVSFTPGFSTIYGIWSSVMYACRHVNFQKGRLSPALVANVPLSLSRITIGRIEHHVN